MEPSCAPERDENDLGHLLTAAFTALPVGITVHDHDGRCILANAAALRLEDRQLLATNAPSQREVETHRQPLGAAHVGWTLTTLVDVSHHHEAQRDLVKRSSTDALTGLPTRTYLEESVDALIVSADVDTAFALAFIDLDNFKHINDYYSHAAGDALLARVADRIGSTLRPGDTLARVGGDEFVLVLNPVADAEAARIAVGAVAERLKLPFYLDGHEVFASASIGVSLFPDHGKTYDALRRQADNAMYRVKADVKGGVRLFEESMAQAATARMAIEQRLRLAIRDRCFRCAFQPKVEMRSGKVHGVEVLLRWRDEEGTIQAPAGFIDLAIELGLIDDIAFQVLAEVTASIPEIDAKFGADVTISLNVAAKQACDTDFMFPFVDALAETGQADRFVLEITEEAFFTKGRFQTEVLPRIRAVGARVSIDDFGVGYSSLSALAEITADEVKIDRSFIQDIHLRPRSQIVLRAIESIGQALGMTIIAEGVETFEEVAYLQAATQIRYAQGYYFARPMLLETSQRESSHVSSRRDETLRGRVQQSRMRVGGRGG